MIERTQNNCVSLKMSVRVITYFLIHAVFQDLKLYKECISYEILLLPRILLFLLLDISLRITHKKLKIVQTTESYELFQLLE